MKPKKLSKEFSVAEVELVYRRKASNENRVNITSADDVYKVLKENWNPDKISLREEFKIVLMEHNNDCIGISQISSGGFSACLVDPKIVFATALKAKASAIILAHNHPSGNTKPSKNDLAITKTLVEGGKLLEIKVLDHIILTPESYISFANEGLMNS